MPFDSTLPRNNTPADAGEMRNQLNGLKDLIDIPETDPVFVASEAALFVPGDKAKLDAADTVAARTAAIAAIPTGIAVVASASWLAQAGPLTALTYAAPAGVYSVRVFFNITAMMSPGFSVDVAFSDNRGTAQTTPIPFLGGTVPPGPSLNLAPGNAVMWCGLPVAFATDGSAAIVVNVTAPGFGEMYDLFVVVERLV